jgi:hypothetical protein
MSAHPKCNAVAPDHLWWIVNFFQIVCDEELDVPTYRDGNFSFLYYTYYLNRMFCYRIFCDKGLQPGVFRPCIIFLSSFPMFLLSCFNLIVSFYDLSLSRCFHISFIFLLVLPDSLFPPCCWYPKMSLIFTVSLVFTYTIPESSC